MITIISSLHFLETNFLNDKRITDSEEKIDLWILDKGIEIIDVLKIIGPVFSRVNYHLINFTNDYDRNIIADNLKNNCKNVCFSEFKVNEKPQEKIDNPFVNRHFRPCNTQDITENSNDNAKKRGRLSKETQQELINDIRYFNYSDDELIKKYNISLITLKKYQKEIKPEKEPESVKSSPVPKITFDMSETHSQINESGEIYHHYTGDLGDETFDKLRELIQMKNIPLKDIQICHLEKIIEKKALESDYETFKKIVQKNISSISCGFFDILWKEFILPLKDSEHNFIVTQREKHLI